MRRIINLAHRKDRNLVKISSWFSIILLNNDFPYSFREKRTKEWDIAEGLVPRPRILSWAQCKWVYKTKRKADGTIGRLKVSLQRTIVTTGC